MTPNESIIKQHKILLMKIRILAFALVSALCLFSCGDSCDVLEENIIGTWSSPNLAAGSFTFSEGGNLDDPSDILIADPAGASTAQKTWTTTGNSLLVITLPTDSVTFESRINITSFECDTINTEQDGNTFVLIRQ